MNLVSGGGNEPHQQTHWFSESGIIDLYIMTGPSPKDVVRQYGSLTGTTPLPQRFALGYHQCRWNYNDQEDVHSVDKGFDQHDIPYDVLWLDIEHTNDKKLVVFIVNLLSINKFSNVPLISLTDILRGTRLSFLNH